MGDGNTGVGIGGGDDDDDDDDDNDDDDRGAIGDIGSIRSRFTRRNPIGPRYCAHTVCDITHGATVTCVKARRVVHICI